MSFDQNNQPKGQKCNQSHQNNAKETQYSSNTTNTLASYEIAETETQKLVLEIEERCLELLLYRHTLHERCLLREPNITPALMEELTAQARLDSRDLSVYGLDHEMISLNRIMLQAEFEIRELKQITVGLWNHRIMEGYRLWAKERVDGKGQLGQTHDRVDEKYTKVLDQRVRRALELCNARGI